MNWRLRSVEFSLTLAKKSLSFWKEAEAKTSLEIRGEAGYKYIRSIKSHRKNAQAEVLQLEKELAKLKEEDVHTQVQSSGE